MAFNTLERPYINIGRSLSECPLELGFTWQTVYVYILSYVAVN